MTTLHPIGVIHTPILEPGAAPIQSARSDLQGVAEVWPEFEQGLDGIEGFSHVYLLYLFDRRLTNIDAVKPYLDDQERGLFTTRYPCRPTRSGFPLCSFVSRQNKLRSRGGYVGSNPSVGCQALHPGV
jgi:tRNA (Thr-GGU) A37 N-methylase